MFRFEFWKCPVLQAFAAPLLRSGIKSLKPFKNMRVFAGPYLRAIRVSTQYHAG